MLCGIVSGMGTVHGQNENANTTNISNQNYQENIEQQSQVEFHSNRLIIIYDEDVPQVQKYSVLPQNYSILYDYSILNGMAIKIPNETDLSTIKADLEQQDHVSKVFEDYQVHHYLFDSIPQIHGEIPFSSGYTGSGVKVCVIDSGVENSHPALNPLIAQIDFVNFDSDATDDYGHGTHVAGILSSTNSTNQGVAPGASLMAAKVLDQNGNGLAADVIAGINWCVVNGADVINLSLGTRFPDVFSGTCDGDPMAIAANTASNQGVLVVAASGNDGQNDKMGAPSCGSNVFAVGSVDKSNVRAPTSNGGVELDLVAPGVSITSTVPTSPCTLCDSSGWKSLSGTSMATPHVSGAAALILDKYPSWSPLQVKNEIKNNTIDFGDPGFDFLYGNGRLDLIFLFDEPPEITILSPLLGTNFTEGGSILFSGNATDIDDGDISSFLEWTTDLDGLVGVGGSFTNSSLSVGTHTLTANVTDSGGSSDMEQISITVNPPNTAPVVEITTPTNGTKFFEGQNINFSGNATDFEDGNIFSDLLWDSDLDGLVGIGGSFTNSSLSVGTHTITANVTDSGGLSDSREISIIINTISSCLPSVRGDWIVISNCILNENTNIAENVVVKNNSTLLISNGTTLNIDLENFNLTIEAGSKVWINSGGIIT